MNLEPFKDWIATLPEDLPYKKGELALMAWQAALRHAAEICDEIYACDCILNEDCPHKGADECSKAIEREAGNTPDV